MKRLQVLIAAFAALCAGNANAQIFSDNESYSRVELSFVSQIQKTSASVSSISVSAEEKPKGVAIGFIHGFKMNCPLFVETGATATFTHLKNTYEDDMEATGNYINVAVPVNFAMKLHFSDNLTLSPFFGPNLKFNILAKENIDGYPCVEIDYFDNEYGFESKRFQFGLNIGIGATLSKHWYVGYKFQPDLTNFTTFDITDDVSADFKTQSHYITLGFAF